MPLLAKWFVRTLPSCPRQPWGAWHPSVGTGATSPAIPALLWLNSPVADPSCHKTALVANYTRLGLCSRPPSARGARMEKKAASPDLEGNVAFLKVIVQVPHFLLKGRQTMQDLRAKTSSALSSCGTSWFCAVDSRHYYPHFPTAETGSGGERICPRHTASKHRRLRGGSPNTVPVPR